MCIYGKFKSLERAHKTIIIIVIAVVVWLDLENGDFDAVNCLMDGDRAQNYWRGFF